MNGVTENTLLGGRVRLVQPRAGYRAAIDPVLLAAATPARPGERVLDLGAGTGAAGLCLAARVPGVRVVGLELQPELAGLAAAGAAASGLAGRVAVVCGDLRAPPLAGGFDRVMANPPFLRPGAHTPPPVPGKALAHGEGAGTLADWIAAAHGLLRPGGTVTLVHRADRLDETMALLHRRFGGIVVFPLWPRAGLPARRVLVLGRKGGLGPARLAAGLVLHRPDGGFTPEAQTALRDAAPLALLD